MIRHRSDRSEWSRLIDLFLRRGRTRVPSAVFMKFLWACFMEPSASQLAADGSKLKSDAVTRRWMRAMSGVLWRARDSVMTLNSKAAMMTPFHQGCLCACLRDGKPISRGLSLFVPPREQLFCRQSINIKTQPEPVITIHITRWSS